MSPEDFVVNCVNCRKQNIIMSDDPYDVKCEFGNHKVRIKIKQEVTNKMPEKQEEGTMGNTDQHPAGEASPSTATGLKQANLPELVHLGADAANVGTAAAPASPPPPAAAPTDAPLYEGKPHKYHTGKRKWAKRCSECTACYEHDGQPWCSSKHCPQRCPAKLRPSYRPKLDEQVDEAQHTPTRGTEVPLRPKHRKDLPQYKDGILPLVH